MTTSVTAGEYPANDTQAHFQAWGGAVSGALVAVGLTKTGDTGQINWSTVALPVGTNAVGGYEIYAFNDALQATAPIFIKIEYANGPNPATAPQIFITVGKGSDGAGNITGVLLARSAVPMATYSVTTLLASYVSYNATLGVLTINLWPGLTGYMAPVVMVERSRDANSNPTGNAIGVHFNNPTTNGTACSNWAAINYANGTSCSGGVPVMFPNTVGGAAVSASSTLSPDGGTTVPVLPIPFVCPGVPPWFSAGMVAVAPADGGTFTATVNNSSHTFRTVAPPTIGGVGGCSIFLCTGSTYSVGIGSTMPAAFLWE